jgi:hypothetical protein
MAKNPVEMSDRELAEIIGSKPITDWDYHAGSGKGAAPVTVHVLVVCLRRSVGLWLHDCRRRLVVPHLQRDQRDRIVVCGGGRHLSRAQRHLSRCRRCRTRPRIEGAPPPPKYGRAIANGATTARSGGFPHRIGRLQRAVRRAFWATTDAMAAEEGISPL